MEICRHFGGLLRAGITHPFHNFQWRYGFSKFNHFRSDKQPDLRATTPVSGDVRDCPEMVLRDVCRFALWAFNKMAIVASSAGWLAMATGQELPEV